MKRDFPRWLILFAAISFAVFGAIRADATGISADLDPSDGDQGLDFAEVPPGESVKIQLFAHGPENLTGFVAQIEFDPGAVDGASTAIGFSPGPATPVTFPVTVRRTVATGMGGQLPPNPVSEDLLLLGTFTFNTHPQYKGGGFRILKVEVKHGRDPSEAIEPGIELHIGPPGGGGDDDHGPEGDDEHEGDRGPGPGEGRGPSPEQLARMFDRWMKSDRAEDLNDDGEINGEDFKIFMDKMREEHEGDHDPEGDDEHEGDRGPGPGEGRGPSPEQIARMFDRWIKSDRAEDLNDDGEINGEDFKIFMDRMREEHEGDHGPEGDDEHEGDRGPGPGGDRGPSPEDLARMFGRWIKSDRAEDLNDDGEINGEDFKIFMDKMREEREGDHGPEGDDEHEGDRGPGPGEGRGPSPEQLARMFGRWIKSDRAEDLNDDGEINGEDFKIFMDRMREEHEGDRGPEGDDGHEGDHGPGPGNGGPGDQGQHGPPPGDPGRVFEGIMEMYPDPDKMPEGLGEILKEAETAHHAALEAREGALKAGIAFLEAFLPHAKDRELAKRVEEAIHHMKERLERVHEELERKREDHD